jgi:uncharacterized protein
MDLQTFSSENDNFYSPAAVVELFGSDVMRTMGMAVSQLEIERSVGTAGRFSFTLTDCYEFEHREFRTQHGVNVFELLRLGASIKIRLGYGDTSKMPILLWGIVTEVRTEFPETGSPELHISGFDNAHPMTMGKNSNSWKYTKDSNVARDIASFHSLNAKIEETTTEQRQIEQNQESDFEFLKKLADRNSYELYVDEKNTLHFHKPDYQNSPALELAWGEGLLSFKPEVNLAGQVSRVEVYGHNDTGRKTIVGVATSGSDLDFIGNSRGAAERAKELSKGKTGLGVLRIRQPVHSTAEANSRAQAAMNEITRQLLTGEGETIGLPALMPDTRIKILKLGVPFSRPYYVTSATHKFDSAGYRTRFKIRGSAI